MSAAEPLKEPAGKRGHVVIARSGPPIERACCLITIDLAAIRTNWRRLVNLLAPGALCAAVVKADSYGLDMSLIAPVLYDEGCQHFFVARLEEGIRLRSVLSSCTIYVLDGPTDAACLSRYRLTPVLNDREDIDIWVAHARQLNQRLPAVLHVDTGMARLGMTREDCQHLMQRGLGSLEQIRCVFVMSHLACASDADHPMNEEQRAAFVALRAALPPAPASLVSSAGIFLGPSYHFDLARAGIALYGIVPNSKPREDLIPAITIDTRILQLRYLDQGEPLGYGSLVRVKRSSRIAILAFGYADGWPRSLPLGGDRESPSSEDIMVKVADRLVPHIGRVSMDLITADVTDLPEGVVFKRDWVRLIDDELRIETLAHASGTIGHELLTRLGGRAHRRYLDRPGSKKLVRR